MGIIAKVLQNQQQREAEEERKLLRFESSIGRQLFGKIPDGHNREFFALDTNTWVWHEDWIDKNGKRITLSTRYSVRPSGVIKSLNGQPYQPVDDTEKRNLLIAIKHYSDQVSAEYHKLIQKQAA